jgi:hypothetical protein
MWSSTNAGKRRGAFLSDLTLRAANESRRASEMKRCVVLASALLLLPVAAQTAPMWPTLQGFCMIQTTQWVSLRSEEDGQRWVQVGGHFNGYEVDRWDSLREAVILRHGAEILAVYFGLNEAPHAQAIEGGEANHTAIILENLRRLAVTACQQLVEQDSRRVTITELVGPDKPILRLEPAADETYADVAFSIGPAGLEISIAGKSILLLPSKEPFVIQVSPTQSLAVISARLHLSLEKLAALNPRLASGPIREWTSVRLQ